MFDRMESKTINKSSLPLISVIIPCFNYAHFLPETLQSLINQTYSNWECIVVDDGSSDNTIDVVNHYLQVDSRFQYIYQHNQGLSAARNTGLLHSKGHYIQFLDADDLIESQKLEVQVNFLENNKEVHIVYGRVLYFSFDTGTQKNQINDEPHIPRISGSGMPLIKYLTYINITAVHTTLSRRAVFESVGDFDVTLKSLEDWDYWWRCALKGFNFKYLYKENSSALYRMHPSSMSKDKWQMKFMELCLRRRMASLLGEKELIEMNNEHISKINKYLYIGVWKDIFTKSEGEKVDKLMRLFNYRKQLKYLCDLYVVKYLPVGLSKIYYIFRAGQLVDIFNKRLKSLNNFKFE